MIFQCSHVGHVHIVKDLGEVAGSPKLISNKSKSGADDRSDPETFGLPTDFILQKSLIPRLASPSIAKTLGTEGRQVQRRHPSCNLHCARGKRIRDGEKKGQ